jgi:hypothetical protein
MQRQTSLWAGTLSISILLTFAVQAAEVRAPTSKADPVGTPPSRKGAQPAALDVDPHLVSWWKFDEAAGTVAADSAKQGHKGILEGGLSFDTHSAPGRVGKAIRLDGGNHCIRIAGFKGVTGSGPRTIAVWIKTPVANGEIVSWGFDDHGKMWSLGFIRERIGVTPKGGYLYINAALHDDSWHHVAAVVQKAAPPNLHDDVKLYVNGKPAEIHDIGLLDLWPIETGDKQDVTIGRQWKGCLDDLRIYDRALSEEEIVALFRRPENP